MDTAIDKIAHRVKSLRNRYATYDAQASAVILARRGQWQLLAPDLFSDDFDKMTVANMIDTTARDIAAVLAPLPTISCSSSTAHPSDRAKAFADKRSKIAKSYVNSSRLAWQMNKKGADQLHSFGMLVFCIEPDFKNSRPLIRIKDAVGSYPVFNGMGDVVEMARVYIRPWVDVAAEHEIPATLAHDYGKSLDCEVEVVEYSNSQYIVTYLPQMGNRILTSTDNVFGKCNYVVATRPGLLDGEIKGAYEDMIWVQLVRHRLQMLILEGVEDAVQAPLVVPNDAQDLAIGSRAIIRTQQGASSVSRARLDIPPQAFTMGEVLREEMREGAMSPGVRAGDSDASVITGKGISALQGMYQSQISSLQTQIADGLERAIAMAFEFDELVFGDVKKEIRGQDAGVPYKETYVPSKDISGDYTVEISYGFAAGIGDPNRALVYILQANQAGLVSRDFAQRSLPGGISPQDEATKIQIEQSRDGIIQGMSALVQSIPALAANGQDPTGPIMQQAKLIKALQDGDTPEEAAMKALAPEPPPPGAAPAADAAGIDGFRSQGIPEGLDPNAITEGQGGTPDLLQTFASMTSGGQAKLTSGVAMSRPV